MSSALSPDQIIEDLGGCGRYQIRMSVIVHVMKTLVGWSVISMVVFSKTPPWSCDVTHSDLMNNITPVEHTFNKTYVVFMNNMSAEYTNNKSSHLKSCVFEGDTKCTKFRFDGDFKTIISEFDLVCDRAFIPSTIMSIQTAGTLFGNVIAGQLADLFGRKIPFFSSIVMLILANLVGFFSNNWILFVVTRFVIGAGAGFFLTIQYSLLSEFSLSKWRAWIIGFPSWPIQQCMFALVAWLIQDWRYIQLVCVVFGIPCLLAWWFIPESFRWYIAHDRPHDAEKIIRKVAEYNRHPESVHMQQLLKTTETTAKDTKYTILDLFKSRFLIRVTVLSAFNWIALGLVAYGISFGIPALSGNLYLNFFLFGLTAIPTKALAMWLQNRFGRRKTAILCYCITGISGFIVGIVQYIETDLRDELTNGFALVANMGIQMAWGPVQTMTIELFPTVVRNIGFGSLSTMARLGAIVGPQLVFLNSFVPGLLFFVCGILSTLCVCGLFGLPETMNANLADKIQLVTIKVEKESTEHVV